MESEFDDSPRGTGTRLIQNLKGGGLSSHSDCGNSTSAGCRDGSRKTPGDAQTDCRRRRRRVKRVPGVLQGAEGEIHAVRRSRRALSAACLNHRSQRGRSEASRELSNENSSSSERSGITALMILGNDFPIQVCLVQRRRFSP